MSRKVTVQNNQNVFDAALMLTGSVEGVFGIMKQYGTTNPSFVPGQVVVSEELFQEELSSNFLSAPPATETQEYMEPSYFSDDFDTRDFDTTDFY